MRSSQTIRHTTRGPSDVDERMMQRALDLARKSEGRVEPNPMVGCVISRGGRILGEGYHRRFGGAHAEVQALRACTADPRGATVYVSLEPCCHFGKTPPCVDALIIAGVARVVAAVRDPNPLVDGRGLALLRGAGIRVDVGVCAADAAEILTPFITRMRLHRPYVIAKWAQSLDGKLATRTRDSRGISGPSSLERVHKLRARVDAVLVGSGTVAADDPMLTARNVTLRRQALRVVLDGRLRLPETCRLVATARKFPTLVMTSSQRARSAKARRLIRCGIEVVAIPIFHRGASLAACLRVLARREATNVLVEGGSAVLTSFFEAGLVDEAHVYVSPRLIGGSRAPSAIAGNGVARVMNAITPRSIQVQRSGEDVLFRLRLTDPPAR